MWIGRYFLFLLSIILAFSASASESVSGVNQKVELIQTEICYARFLIYNIKVKNLGVDDGLDWINDLLLVAESQMDDLKEGNLSLDDDQDQDSDY